MKNIISLLVVLFISIGINGQNIGLEQLTDIDKLPVLNTAVITMQNSSHDPEGGNKDGFKAENGEPAQNNFYGHYNGENIMLRVKGKGIVKRIWLTGFDGTSGVCCDWTQRIKIYFDGEELPRIDERVVDFFDKSNRSADYYPNLIAGYWESSMGSISYIPFPFENEIIITTNADDYAPDATNYFNNVQYEMYPADADITSWNGYDGLTEENNILANKGSDPRSDQTYETQNNIIDLAIGESKTAIAINESNKNITGLFVEIPDLDFSGAITDAGRAHTDFSQFEMDVDPNAAKIILRRRFDYGSGNHQIADIYIDGVKAGTMKSEGYDSIDRWRDIDFEIPRSLVGTKTKITIEVKYVSAEFDWNEFRYWTICDGEQTDELDVNNATSETAHNYTTSGGWSGERTYTYGYGFLITDDGRAHTDNSQFTLTVTPNAAEYKLVRRLNFGIGNQKAEVFVDGVSAGVWFDEGRAEVGDSWKDSEFYISSDLVGAKSQLTIKIDYISADVDWNEFRYWMYSDGELSDELDVANTASETAHSYSATGGWSGTVSFEYPGQTPPPVEDGTVEILEKVNIQIFYNGESTPAIDAPLGLFFGTGTFEKVAFQSLPVGIIEGERTMYCYLPMPFENSYEVKLVNNYGKALNGVNVSVNYADFNEDFANCGYLKTQYNNANPPVAGKDHMILDENGSGKYVGVVFEVRDAPNAFWLEGDERFYIDGSRTPQLQGTGLEDYFNGAWYFGHGPFNLAQHGFNAFKDYDRSLYRFHITDPIHFTNGAKFGMEHGPHNDQFADYHTLAYYYHNATAKNELTDEINIGDATSESNHNYTVTGEKQEQLNKSYYFEGDDDDVAVVESGNYIKGSTQFTVAVTPGKAVKIKRMFDYGMQDQQADVYVDNVKVGTWYSVYMNEFKRWREEFFYIPASFTEGKAEITLKFVASDSEFNWSEFRYWIYSVEKGTMLDNDHVKLTSKISVYPNPANDYISVKGLEGKVNNIQIFDLGGREVFISNSSEYINISGLNNGVYLIKVNTETGYFTKKIIKE
ncbi:MAG: DUF2961 domain-containing protein [Bacteroidota bacterium]